MLLAASFANDFGSVIPQNDDDNVGYVSSSRHKSRKPSESQGSVPNSKSRDLSVQELKKLIHEKRILLDALDVEDQHNSLARKQEDETTVGD
ncbi:actin organization and endocytosis protein [Clavispora lusitaniae]|nr:actin organization and endocytosis protein [Clavispora lusitaniae]